MTVMTQLRKQWLLTVSLLAVASCVVSTGSASADDKSDLQNTLDKMLATAKTGDLDKYLAYFDPEYARLIRELLPFADAMTDLVAICKEKFSETLPNSERMDIRGALKRTKSVEVIGELRFEGNTARFRLKTVVGLPEGDETRTEEKDYIATKTDGKWLLSEVDFPRRKEQMEKQLPVIKKLAKVAENVNAEIKAGKYANINEVQRAFNEQARAAVEKP